ncbi:hypothetical protein phiK7A1_019c [Pseudomonas phage phiK7A1]|uniref:Uncharacterized protein n=1 Tax=Pseudomonas phage phiK7A1 TaxID=2759194 RepID=A0A7H0XFL9_9CAUD|nr:hypothetical protein phiK7A1_019c [Pseudomonas phage phiK7A1]
MIWKLRAAWHLKFKYKFDLQDAWELATVLYFNYHAELKYYKPKDAVDEEMSYWGD